MRSSQPEVRNPVLALPEAQELARLLAQNPEIQLAATRLLRALSDQCRVTAENSWRRHKAPMAVYWKRNAVWFRHLGIAMKRTMPMERKAA